jgi:hypothetical protein
MVWRAKVVVLGAVFMLAGLGCVQHRPEPATITGSPEALAVVEKLKGVNDVPASVSATFVFETHQPRGARWAELRGAGADAALADAILKSGSGEYVAVRRIEQKQQGTRYVVSETRTEDGRPVSSEPAKVLIHQTMDSVFGDSGMVSLWTIAGHVPFPCFYGNLSTRREMFGGEECVVILEEYPNSYRETYLLEKEGWLPRRIVEHQKLPSTRPATLPTQDQTFTIERETGKWPFRKRTVESWKVPAAAYRELDLNYGSFDLDITVEKWVKRPDGKWFITQATTVYPLFRRTEQYRVESLSFAPIPQGVFDAADAEKRKR